MDSPFTLEICVADVPASSNLLMIVALAPDSDRNKMPLWAMWALPMAAPDSTQPCDPRTPELICPPTFLCGYVRMQPSVGTLIPLRPAYSYWGSEVLDNSAQIADPRLAATISFADCAAGYEAQYDASSGTMKCVACPAGTQTMGLIEQPSCTPCPAGSFSRHDGCALCELCPVGNFCATEGKVGLQPMRPERLESEHRSH
jgi:hypothetical protein